MSPQKFREIYTKPPPPPLTVIMSPYICPPTQLPPSLNSRPHAQLKSLVLFRVVVRVHGCKSLKVMHTTKFYLGRYFFTLLKRNYVVRIHPELLALTVHAIYHKFYKTLLIRIYYTTCTARFDLSSLLLMDD